jgi:hypothetical protein
MIDTGRLEEIFDIIEDLRSEALSIVRDEPGMDDVTYERAYRGWSSEIQTALSKDNYWLGQISMDTLQETIEACDEFNADSLVREAS